MERSNAVYAPKSNSVIGCIVKKSWLVQVWAHGEPVNLPRTDTDLHLEPVKAQAHVGAFANIDQPRGAILHLVSPGSDPDPVAFIPRPTVRSCFACLHPLTKTTTLDAYYLGLDRKIATFNRGVGHDMRHSIGARLSRPIAEVKPGWDFDYETLWQFGTFGSANIRAWTVASETGYRLPNIPLKPRFSAKADISSGDDPRTNTLGTFNPLFPKGNYFGVLATAGPGPINFIDAHPRVEATLPWGVTASVDWIFQWRESLRHGVYFVLDF